MSAALTFKNVTLGYDRHPAVHHLNGDVQSGALIAVVGPNGAGQIDAVQGHRRHDQAAVRRHRPQRPACA